MGLAVRHAPWPVCMNTNVKGAWSVAPCMQGGTGVPGDVLRDGDKGSWRSQESYGSYIVSIISLTGNILRRSLREGLSAG